MILLLLPLLIISNIGLAYSNCVDINNNNSLTILNSTYSQNCYNHVIQEIDFCNYLLLDETCKYKYKECVDNEKYIVDEIINHCHEHNTEIFDLEFSDYDNYCQNQLIGQCGFTTCDEYTNHFNALPVPGDGYLIQTYYDVNWSNNCYTANIINGCGVIFECGR